MNLEKRLSQGLRDFSENGSIEALLAELLYFYDKATHYGDLYTSLLIAKMTEEYSSDSKVIIGEGYYSAKGLIRNQEKALRLFDEAAKMGSARGLYDKGAAYYVSQEYARAVECFEKSLKTPGLDDFKRGLCHGTLGDSYSRLPVPNTMKAIENLTIAANKYHLQNASFRLGEIYLEQNNPNEKRKAVPYLEDAAKNGVVDAASRLAEFYYYGCEDLEIEPNREKVEQLLSPYSEVDHVGVQYMLAQMNLFGVSGERVDGIQGAEKAVRPLEKLWAASHSATVANKLALAYYWLDRSQDALDLWEYADKENECSFLDFLGRLYISERNDTSLALSCYDRAYHSEDGLNNRFVYCEYYDLLVSADRYDDAFNIAVEGESCFHDIEFIYRQSDLVLKGKHQVSDPYRFVQMMQTCLEYEGYEVQVRNALADYFASVGSYSEARYHLKCLYDQGDKSASYRLGLVSVDEPLLAIKWFTESFNEGNVDAALRIAEVYEKRNNDQDNAYQWYLKAANAGSDVGAIETRKFKRTMLGRYKRM